MTHKIIYSMIDSNKISVTQMGVKFKLDFYGAASVVTGSSYILTIIEDDEVVSRVMVDHGMFLGKADESRNYNDYSFDPTGIDSLIVTHAHTDHCGLIPKLVKHGFTGKVYCSQQTSELLGLMLADSAKIQKRQQQFEGIPVIYDHTDVEKTLQNVVSVKERTSVALANENVILELFSAGHILGANSVHIKYKNKQIMFSGDIGRRTQPIIRKYDQSIKSADYVVCESLYGAKNHDEISTLLGDFYTKIEAAAKRGENVIIPTFSIQRAQEITYLLVKAQEEGQLDQAVQIYFDSPLASKVSKVYTDNNYALAEEFTEITPLSDYLYSARVKYVKGRSMLERLKKEKGNIIVTGGGMCNGGKVLAYFKSMLEKSDTYIAIVGYQAEDTLGRKLVEGDRTVIIDGSSFNVNAKIDVFRGFSAHGDQADLLDWLHLFDYNKLDTVFLVHAEPEQSMPLADILKSEGLKVEIPKIGDGYEL